MPQKKAVTAASPKGIATLPRELLDLIAVAYLAALPPVGGCGHEELISNYNKTMAPLETLSSAIHETAVRDFFEHATIRDTMLSPTTGSPFHSLSMPNLISRQTINLEIRIPTSTCTGDATPNKSPQSKAGDWENTMLAIKTHYPNVKSVTIDMHFGDLCSATASREDLERLYARVYFIVLHCAPAISGSTAFRRFFKASGDDFKCAPYEFLTLVAGTIEERADAAYRAAKRVLDRFGLSVWGPA